MRRARLIAATLCIVVGICLIGVHLWATYVTASGRPRALWHGALPGLDIGLDSSPAAPGQAGYVEVWVYPHDADDYMPLLRLPGAPAQMTPLPEPRPGELST